MTAEIAFLLRILMVIFIFGFIYFCMNTIYRMLRSELETKDQYQVPAITFSFFENDLQEERRMSKSVFVMGRDPSCDLQIVDPTISIKHAQFSFHHSQWWIEDLESTNGSYLNEQPIFEPMIITDSDHLRCGRIMFTIKIESAPIQKNLSK